MKDKDQLETDDNFIDRKIAEAFGYGEQQLADELDRAVEEARDQQLTAPEDELQKIRERLDRSHSGFHKKHKVVRIRKMAKVLIAAAVLGSMLVSGSMWVGAKRFYRYEVRRKDNAWDIMILNNGENLIDDSAGTAYAEIARELNIDVLQLSYLPEGMLFSEVSIGKKRSVMEFQDATGSLFLTQGINDKPSSLSYNSDLNICQKIYNPFLDQEVAVYQKQLENGNIELSARIIEEDQYCFLEGIYDFEKFKKIVEGIKSYNNAE